MPMCGWTGIAWIIPARAGFTLAAEAGGGLRTDHPRSRGVYAPVRSWPGALCGSSPLARGLHATGRYRDNRRGIIPARAGFTSSPAT